MTFGGRSPPNQRQAPHNNENINTNQIGKSTLVQTNEQGSSEADKMAQADQKASASLKNPQSISLNQQDLSNVQSGSKIPVILNQQDLSNVQSGSKIPTLSLKNSQNINLRGKSESSGNPLRASNELSFLSGNQRQFQDKNYVNYARGSKSSGKNCIGLDETSELFDANYLNSRNMGSLSSTRRQSFMPAMEDELVRSAEIIAEERLRLQNERHQIELQRLTNNKNQNRVMEDMKNMVENLQTELAAERSRMNNNTSSNIDGLTALMTTLLNNTTTATSSRTLGPDDRRHKVLESIAKNPIDQWQFGVNGNLYIHLRFKAEPYLKSKSFTKAETAQAIGSIFSQSHYAEEKATDICMQNLPNHPEKLEDRIETYKALARELDENGGITIEPLNSEERVIDLFLRCKLILECEMDGSQIEVGSEAEEKLNHRVIKKMLNRSENLLPDEDQEKIAALWNSMQVTSATMGKGCIKTEQALSLFNNYDSMRVLRMQSNTGERKKKYQDLASTRENIWSKQPKKNNCEICFRNHETKNCPVIIYGPCEKCLSTGIPRNKIKHTTRGHKFDNNSDRNQNNQASFGPPPPSLQKYNKGSFNLMANATEVLKNKREITLNDQGYLCLRIEVDKNIVEIILDTGCLFEGVIEGSMVEALNLQKYKVQDPTTVCFADGNKTVYETVLEVPVRFKNVATLLKIVVMEKLPAKFILGTPGMQKLGFQFDICNQKN